MSLLQRQSPLELAPPGVTPNYIDPVSRGPELVRVSIALVSLAAVFVAVRFIVKIFMTKSPAWDDAFSLAALVSLSEGWCKVEPTVDPFSYDISCARSRALPLHASVRWQ